MVLILFQTRGSFWSPKLVRQGYESCSEFVIVHVYIHFSICMCISCTWVALSIDLVLQLCNHARRFLFFSFHWNGPYKLQNYSAGSTKSSRDHWHALFINLWMCYFLSVFPFSLINHIVSSIYQNHLSPTLFTTLSYFTIHRYKSGKSSIRIRWCSY